MMTGSPGVIAIPSGRRFHHTRSPTSGMRIAMKSASNIGSLRGLALFADQLGELFAPTFQHCLMRNVDVRIVSLAKKRCCWDGARRLEHDLFVGVKLARAVLEHDIDLLVAELHELAVGCDLAVPRNGVSELVTVSQLFVARQINRLDQRALFLTAKGSRVVLPHLHARRVALGFLLKHLAAAHAHATRKRFFHRPLQLRERCDPFLVVERRARHQTCVPRLHTRSVQSWLAKSCLMSMMANCLPPYTTIMSSVM